MENELSFESIFINQKILNNLLSFLSLAEQKDLQRTCTTFTKTIRKSSTFLQRTKLIICGKSIENTKVFKSMTYPWMNVRIELTDIPLPTLDIIKRIMRNVDSIELHLLNGYNQEMTSLTLTHSLTEILASAHQLRCLALDCALMEKELKNVLTDERVRMRLRGLQELYFLHSFAKSDTFNSIKEYASFGKAEFRKTYKILGTYGLWNRNFNHLLAIPMSLKHLDVGKIVSSKESYLNVLPALLNTHALTLNQLNIPMNIWDKGISYISFPNLQSLTLRARHEEEDSVRKFLVTQPELKHLDIGFVSGFPLSVLMLIDAKSSSEILKSLHIKCSYFVGSLDPINWMCLRNMTALKDFSLNLKAVQKKSTSSNLIAPTYFLDVLSSLPETVEKIVLKNVHLKGHATKDQQQTIVGFAIKRFTCLTKFNVMGCQEAVNDTLLQYLFANAKGLKVLKFSHCNEVTKFGLTGLKSSGLSSGFSLDSLKELREFAIRHCPAITSAELLNAVKLERLQTLEVFTEQTNTKSTVVKLLKQNPSLEKIYINVSRMDFNELTLVLSKTNNRTCQLTRILDTKTFRVNCDTDSSERESEDAQVDKDKCEADTTVPVSTKTIAALKIADKLKELCFDEELDDDDLSRFDSDDNDDFQGCAFIPG